MEVMDFLVPLAAIVMVFGIPIAAIVTSHQRKMAEIIHKGAAGQEQMGMVMQELHRLRGEVARLQDAVNQQALALDDVRGLGVGRGPASGVESELSERVSE